MKKSAKSLLIACLGVAVPNLSFADAAAVESQYNKSCVACHASGAAGAPRTGVAAEWQPRLGKGMDVLVENAIKGVNAMPPKGMCFDCTEADMKALIEFMSAGK